MENNREKILQWLEKPPFYDVEKAIREEDFSYSEWFKEGKSIPQVAEELIGLLNENLEKPDLAFKIAYAMGWVGDSRCTKPLLSVIHSHDIQLRIEAIAALGRLKSLDSFVLLNNILSDRNEDTNVRANACIAIANISHQESKKTLLKFTSDSDSFVSSCAKEGLRILEGK